MPPKINLQRTHVAPEFVELMLSMYGEWAQRNANLIQRAIGNPTFEHFIYTARRLRPIVRRQSPSPREGLDYEITRLRGLPYTSFGVIAGPDPSDSDSEIVWLVGQTKPVVITDFRNRRSVMGHLGCYRVHVPSTIIQTPQLGHIHMIPMRNELSKNRHPHHYLNWYDEIERSPLSYPTGNCYGSYNGVIKNLIDEPDFPELFRQLYYHLSTYGEMPPRRMSDLDFDYQTPE